MTFKKIFVLWSLLAIWTLCFVSCDQTTPPPTDSEACAHVFSEWDTAVPPTCTQMGLLKRVCTLCGAEETAPTLSTSHDYEIKPAIAPTCTEAGATTGIVCRACGLVAEEQLTLPATGHTEIIDPGKAPTCTAEGLSDGKHCTKCGEVTVAQTPVPAMGHAEITDLGKEATCTAEGLTEGKHCSRCGEITAAQTIIPAKGHTEETISSVEPTCTAQGFTEGIRCSACGKTLSGCETVPAKGHTVVIDPRVEPTCTEDGLSEGQHCSVCGHILYRQVVRPATGHTETVTAGKPATCTEEGLTEGKHCAKCGEITVPQTIIPAKGHTEVIIPRVEPTCTEQGMTERVTCSVCGATLSGGTPLAALGHAAVTDPGVAPTCTEEGLSEGKHCSDCGEILTAQKPLAALGHHAVAIPMKPATCTEGGLTEGSLCDRCDRILTAQVPTAPLGHDYNESGLCTRCDSSLASVGLEFDPAPDGTCYVSGIGSCTDTHIRVPRVSPDGATVVGIYSEAFYGAKGLTAVTVPNTVTSLGSLLSYLDASVEVYFQGSRTEWLAITAHEEYTYDVKTRYVHCADGDVFMCNSSAEDPRFAFTSNGDGTCYVSGIGTATRGVIPRYSPAGDLVTAIGEGALKGMDCMVVGIPDSVTRIEANAFQNAGFETISIADSVTYIGDRAFYQLSYSWATQEVCDAIGRLTNLTYLGKYALAVSSGEGGLSLVLPEGVTTVEDGLLSGGYYCDRTLTIPKSVTYIGKSIFAGWRTNATITYGGTVTEWRALEKHADWNSEMYPITITCTDGQVVTEDRHTPL
ncbi:MAG: leucine-rich repeat domain-containing protein [Clostridia bacterium]|nr:leucine-rich repeat domain-containing protein [Clostridia bacterium]